METLWGYFCCAWLGGGQANVPVSSSRSRRRVKPTEKAAATKIIELATSSVAPGFKGSSSSSSSSGGGGGGSSSRNHRSSTSGGTKNTSTKNTSNEKASNLAAGISFSSKEEKEEYKKMVVSLQFPFPMSPILPTSRVVPSQPFSSCRVLFPSSSAKGILQSKLNPREYKLMCVSVGSVCMRAYACAAKGHLGDRRREWGYCGYFTGLCVAALDQHGIPRTLQKKSFEGRSENPPTSHPEKVSSS